MKKLLYILLVCVLGFSCKKTELPQTNDEGTGPVFYFKGNVNGTPVRIDAGVDNYVMNASYYQDEQNLYIYKADFKQSSCTNNCGFGLTILINDFKISQPESKMFVDSALRAVKYDFLDGSLKKLFYSGSFAPVLPATVNDHFTWKFNGAGVQTSATATYVFEAGTNYSVYLKCNNDLGLSSELTKEFKIGNPLQANIKLKSFIGSTCKFAAEPARAGLNYEWDFGDGSPTNNEAEPEHTYTLPLNYLVKLKLTDADNNICVSNYQVKPTTDCSANFNSTFTPFINPKLLSAINVVLTDPSGKVYVSSDLQQPAHSQFEIVSVEEYKVNDKNQPTKKIKIKFNCRFESTDGPVQITDGEAVIAVAYK